MYKWPQKVPRQLWKMNQLQPVFQQLNEDKVTSTESCSVLTISQSEWYSPDQVLLFILLLCFHGFQFWASSSGSLEQQYHSVTLLWLLSETQFRIPTSVYKTASMKSQAKVAPDALNQRLYQNSSLATALETQSSQGLTWVVHASRL